MKQVVIRKKKVVALRRRHPWVFSGAIKTAPEGVQDGDTVQVVGEDEEPLGFGHFQHGSIMVRMITFGEAMPDQAFWDDRLQNAWNCRSVLGLTQREDLNAYRLIHAEGDGLPGLIIDIYAGVAVVQCHSIGMHRALPQLTLALRNVLGAQLSAVYDKSAETLPRNYAEAITNGYVWGESAPTPVLEYGHQFWVNWETGQKTGFFIDQRENRQLLAKYAPGKKVLNTFCYTGGFSIYALQAGARQVDSVDVSQPAMELTDRNVALGGFEAGRHHSHTQDVMTFLKTAPTDYDIVVVDPPAFAKNIKKRHNAVQGYKRLNALALQKVKPGGLLFTFSCSQVVDRALFNNTIVAAAHEAGRSARILHQLSQPADHPVGIFHPEGEYLKGLVLYVD
ncbi:MAG: class I SAM-dependent rRNA methyltransferase [Phaeodactylibacter sp.]|uniref:class I SAM-dependent rRNA methyltransferase n=1 Tax=Phaeodactylibacter sp. TaxID=1940289 RepID=UPI0032EE6A09